MNPDEVADQLREIDRQIAVAIEPWREPIVELEQAGDSALRAAEEEEGIRQSTRGGRAAHATVSRLKAQTKV
jgi:hypothetical protein